MRHRTLAAVALSASLLAGPAAAGRASLSIDLLQLPSPAGPFTVR